MRKNNKILILLLITIILCLLLCGCGNRAGLSESINNEFNYVVIKEADVYVVHEVEKWADYESDALLIETKCCDNIIMTSCNSAILYKEIPNLTNIKMCEVE